ncbi:hypothetical protein FUAX_28480 [Fulvitalea axinellae]|uniref:DUF4350 domain-containing protein n=1 Tax=Fulvitalea axinellae TaxID=1182444 RepID=A0AAU9CE59_9BACT|nr:hypothetical protein FUAX_28480 [Fulvitalea axinellae]
MLNTRNLAVIVVLVVVVSSLYYVRTLFVPKYDWRSNYELKSDEPYGLGLFTEIVSASEDVTLIKSALSHYKKLNDSLGRSNYIFVGKRPYLDSADLSNIFDFAKQGNRAMIIAESLPKQLLDSVFVTFSEKELDSLEAIWEEEAEAIEEIIVNTREDSLLVEEFDPDSLSLEASDSIQDALAKLTEDNYFGPNRRDYKFREQGIFSFGPENSKREYYPFTYRSGKKDRRGRWYYFDEDERLRPNADTLIWLYADKMAGIKLHYGEGEIIVAQNPRPLTNYFLKDSVGAEFASLLLSSLQDGPVFLDAYSHNYRVSFNLGGAQRTPLSYVLSKPQLRSAIYLVLVLALLYVVFESRRKHKAIPLVEAPENSSKAFVENIAQLYYNSKQGEVKVAEHIKNQFFAYIREKYHIPTKGKTDELVEPIAKATGVNSEDIEVLFRQYYATVYESGKSERARKLADFYSSVEKFYEATADGTSVKKQEPEAVA